MAKVKLGANRMPKDTQSVSWRPLKVVLDNIVDDGHMKTLSTQGEQTGKNKDTKKAVR